MNGEKLTAKLHSFNNWRDDFLIEASTLFLMIGFIMGTVDVLTRGGVAVAAWFTLSWSIVQAVAIDGLFFAVWGKIARSTWKKGYRLRLSAMVFVGIVLAIVAMLVNDILSYQQLTGIADSLSAMRSLHIDTVLFVHVRSILVVTIALLVQLFCRGRREEKTAVVEAVENDQSDVLAVVLAEEVEQQTEQLLPLTSRSFAEVLAVDLADENADELPPVDEPIAAALECDSDEERSRATVTIDEAADLLGVSVKYIRELRSKGRLKTASRNGDLITKRSIEAYQLARQKNGKNTGEIPALKIIANGHS